MSEKIEEMLVALSEDSPAGENMEYDPRFVSLETIAAGKPEQQIGDAVSEGEEPDWHKLEAACTELWQETRDLRVAVYFTLSWLKLRGIEGYHDGLELISGLLSDFWGDFYPQLDPDDDNDPLERMNILSWLSPASGSYQDPFDFPGKLRNLVLCSTPRAGKVTLRDLLVASGDLTLPEGSDMPDAALINSVFMDCGVETVGEVMNIFSECYELFKKIDETSCGLAGVNASIDLETVLKLLKTATRLLTDRYRELGGDAPDSGQEGEEGEAPAVGAKSLSGEIGNREDVRLALTKIIRYFELNEPSSPIPFFLKRAQKMLAMDFYQLASELTPESLDRLALIIGQQEED